MAEILKVEQLPPRTKTSHWDALRDELEKESLDGDTGALIRENVDQKEASNVTSSLGGYFRSRKLPYKTATRKVGDRFNVYVIKD